MGVKLDTGTRSVTVLVQEQGMLRMSDSFGHSRDENKTAMSSYAGRVHVTRHAQHDGTKTSNRKLLVWLRRFTN